MEMAYVQSPSHTVETSHLQIRDQCVFFFFVPEFLLLFIPRH